MTPGQRKRYGMHTHFLVGTAPDGLRVILEQVRDAAQAEERAALLRGMLERYTTITVEPSVDRGGP